MRSNHKLLPRLMTWGTKSLDLTAMSTRHSPRLMIWPNNLRWGVPIKVETLGIFTVKTMSPILQLVKSVDDLSPELLSWQCCQYSRNFWVHNLGYYTRKLLWYIGRFNLLTNILSKDVQLYNWTNKDYIRSYYSLTWWKLDWNKETW